jgi:apolipoprotein N-acyltransferase
LASVNRATTGRSHCSVKSAALILSLVAGAFLMAMSLGTSGYSWLGWLTLLPLFIAIRALRPWHASLCGALWGFCLHLFGVAVFETSISVGLGSLALRTPVVRRG